MWALTVSGSPLQAKEPRVYMRVLSEAYVLGLMAEVAERLPGAHLALSSAKERVASVEAELGASTAAHQKAAAQVRACAEKQGKYQVELGELNQAIAAAHQQTAALKRKLEELQEEMDREGKGQLFRRLRRERAKQLNLIDDREGKLSKLQSRVQEIRAGLGEMDGTVKRANEQLHETRSILESHQEALPAPELYNQVFELTVSQAHCEFFLDRVAAPWCESVHGAIAWVASLHSALRAGKYQLDRNSHLVAGRSTASAEAIYAAVAISDLQLARELFVLVTDPSLYFHEIFNVFRIWCVGLWLHGEVAQLKTLLHRYEFAEGLRGGYVQSFFGLIEADPAKVSLGLKEICRHELELWQDPTLNRGLGVVNVGAVALGRLALDAGLRVSIPGNTVPDVLIAR